jgi:hypothetical protein
MTQLQPAVLARAGCQHHLAAQGNQVLLEFRLLLHQQLLQPPLVQLQLGWSVHSSRRRVISQHWQQRVMLQCCCRAAPALSVGLPWGPLVGWVGCSKHSGQLHVPRWTRNQAAQQKGQYQQQCRSLCLAVCRTKVAMLVAAQVA